MMKSLHCSPSRCGQGHGAESRKDGELSEHGDAGDAEEGRDVRRRGSLEIHVDIDVQFKCFNVGGAFLDSAKGELLIDKSPVTSRPVLPREKGQ